jgi:hypothetical protein
VLLYRFRHELNPRGQSKESAMLLRDQAPYLQPYSFLFSDCKAILFFCVKRNASFLIWEFVDFLPQTDLPDMWAYEVWEMCKSLCPPSIAIFSSILAYARTLL